MREILRIKERIVLTELEWKLGFLNLYKMRYLLVKNMRVSPTEANMDIMGCKVRKKEVKNAVLMM